MVWTKLWRGLRLLAMSAAFAVAGLAAPAAAQSFNAQEQAELRALVRAYLVNNPEVIEEALRALEERRFGDAVRRIENEPRAYAMGPRDAPVTIVEFFDYRCPYCHRAADWLFATAARHRDDVRVVFLELPSLGPESLEASRAAIASLKQGRYRAFHRALMGHQGALSSERIDQIARQSGVDVARMRRDMRDPEVDRLIEDAHAMARDAGGQGTPFFLVNGEPVYGFDPARLDALVRAALR